MSAPSKKAASKKAAAKKTSQRAATPDDVAAPGAKRRRSGSKTNGGPADVELTPERLRKAIRLLLELAAGYEASKRNELFSTPGFAEADYVLGSSTVLRTVIREIEHHEAERTRRQEALQLVGEVDGICGAVQTLIATSVAESEIVNLREKLRWILFPREAVATRLADRLIVMARDRATVDLSHRLTLRDEVLDLLHKTGATFYRPSTFLLHGAALDARPIKPKVALREPQQATALLESGAVSPREVIVYGLLSGLCWKQGRMYRRMMALLDALVLEHTRIRQIGAGVVGALASMDQARVKGGEEGSNVGGTESVAASAAMPDAGRSAPESQTSDHGVEADDD